MSAPDTSDRIPLAPVAYPMVDEAEASGSVAAVYAEILERSPMVPSLFKSLAACPRYLELAWDQTRAVLDGDVLTTQAEQLAQRAAGVVPPHGAAPVRAVLARFVAPLARMSIVAAGLRLALEDTLEGPPAAPLADDRPTPSLVPDLDVPPSGELDADQVGTIRRDLATPIVNSIWRIAADAGVLEEAWEHLAPHTRTARFADRSGEVRDAAVRSARLVAWEVVASPRALTRIDLVDVAAGMRTILDAYTTTLPRVLTLVAANVHPAT